MIESMPAQGQMTLGEALDRAVKFHQRGQLASAQQIYSAILKARPDHFDSLHLLGVLKQQQDKVEESLALIASALKLKPDWPEALSNYATALGKAGRHEEALANYDKALALKPNNAELYFNRGNALMSLQRHEQALASYDQALAIKPDYFEALSSRGNALQNLECLDAALAAYDQALAVKPDSAEALNNRGTILQRLDRIDEALASYDRALAIKPDFIDVFNNRGNALMLLDRYEEALASYERILGVRPLDAEALTNRGTALQALGRLEEALSNYQKALCIKPDYADLLNNHGNVLLELTRFDEALASYDKAIELAPKKAEAHFNRANLLREVRHYEEALENYERALALKPDYADVHWNESWARLQQGDFAVGWEKYEWRWKTRSFPIKRRDYGKPQWRGQEQLTGRRIFVHTEQGLGDAIQFARYVPLLAQRGAHVILEVLPSLKALFSGLDGVSEVVVPGQKLPSFDFHCPLISLPLAFKTDLATIPAQVPYFKVSADRIAKWRNRIPLDKRLRVGIAWAGNPKFKGDRPRSIGVQPLVPLLADGRVQFISLQKQLREGDEAILRAHPQVVHVGDELADFCDTAAAMSLVDLVISSDTAIVHLAGALARPLWMLLMFSPDWRWLLDRSDSPWYPTARVFRQPQRGDWGSVVADVGVTLGELVSAWQGLEDTRKMSSRI